MIIKLDKVISCSSEHPNYPASSLLEYKSNSSWRCAKPGEMLITVIFQMTEPSCITGVDIGNYRSCVVIVDASSSTEPDKWIPVVNHQFLTNDEAANNKFKDQVQIFTKKELNPDIMKVKFDRIKVTCMQPANPRELFGLSFITFKTEVIVDLGLDVFGRFKLKESATEKTKNVSDLKEKFFKLTENKQSNFKEDLKAKVKESAIKTFEKRQEEIRDPPKRPLLQKLEEGKTEEVFGKKESKTNEPAKNNSCNTNEKVEYTPFGDIIRIKKTVDNGIPSTSKCENIEISRKHALDSEDCNTTKKLKCLRCNDCSKDELCKNCGQLYDEKEDDNKQVNKVKQKPKKEFSKLFEGITISLSGYVNPKRDTLRTQALQMGAKYNANPNNTNNKCTHLICAFKNTPKYKLLQNCTKIVSHKFIEDCFNNKTRFPWRRYAIDNSDKNQPESEEEIEAIPTDPYNMDTDDSDY